MQRFILIFAFLSAVTLFGAEPAPATQPTPATNARPSVYTAAARPRFVLKDGDRVVFLGDTFMEREQLESYIEAMLTLRFPTNKVIFRNLGWSADTPLGESRAAFDPPEKGFDRLKEHIAAVKPTVVFLSHAMTASFNGVSGLPKFEADMRKLVQAIRDIAGEDARLVFIGPLAHEKLPPPLPDPARHNEDIRWYNEAMRKLAAERRGFFVDLTREMAPASLGQANPPWTDDGIHLTSYGYWRVSRSIEQALGLGMVSRFGISAATGELRMGSMAIEVKNFKKVGTGFEFDGKPGAPVLPPSPDERGRLNANFVRVAVSGLEAGEYALRMDGTPVVVQSSTNW